MGVPANNKTNKYSNYTRGGFGDQKKSVPINLNVVKKDYAKRIQSRYR
jgi:hypothetical protein